MASFPLSKTLRAFSVRQTPLIEVGPMPKFLEKFTKLEYLSMYQSNRVSSLAQKSAFRRVCFSCEIVMLQRCLQNDAAHCSRYLLHPPSRSPKRVKLLRLWLHGFIRSETSMTSIGPD